MSSRAPSTSLVFSMQGEYLLVTTTNNSSKTDENFDGSFVRLLPKISFTVLIANRRPVEVLTELRDKFSTILLFHGGETFDGVVADISATFNSGNVRDTGVRKAYAKYFYETLIKRNSSSLVRDGDIKETALIVTELLSWYFIRRAVHIYVVCTILDKVKTATVASSPSSSFASPVVITSPPVVSEEAKKRVAELEATLRNVQAQLARSGVTTAEGAQLQASLQASIANMQTAMEEREQQLQACSEENQRLREQLNNFKELLLTSTSMIFRMDEIPNLSA